MKIKQILCYNIFHTKKDFLNQLFGIPVYILVDDIWSIARGWHNSDRNFLKYKLNDEYGIIPNSSHWQVIEANEKHPERVVINRNLMTLNQKFPKANNGLNDDFIVVDVPSIGFIRSQRNREREFQEYLSER